MTPKELKDNIIRIALRGQLVNQFHCEGTGEELLSKIKKWREDNFIPKNKRITDILEEDIPFDIPESWIWTKLGNIVEYNMGKTPPRAESEWWGNDVHWVSISDMIENGYVRNTKEYVTNNAIAQKFSNKVSKKGTLLMSFKLTVGRVSILDIDAVHNEAIISIYPSLENDEIIKMYLFNVLPLITTFGESKNAIKGKTLNDSSLANLLIPLPPLEEQKRIVTKIEELIPLVDKYEIAYNKLQSLNNQFPIDLEKSILQYAIEGKLVEQRPEDSTGEDLFKLIQQEKQQLIKEGKIKKEKEFPSVQKKIPFDIPSTWKYVRLGEIVSVCGGKRIPAGRTLSDIKTRQVYIRVSDMKNNTVLLDNLKYVPEDIIPIISRYTISKDDVYITVAGTIGDVGSIPYELDGANLTENANKLVFKKIYKEWLIYSIKSNYIQNQIKEVITKVGQPKLALKRVQDLVIALPPLEEQKRIVKRIEEIMPLIIKLKNKGKTYESCE